MHNLIDRIRDGLDAGRYMNERAVSTSIVIPVLRALGWDDSDPAEVVPEYRNPRGQVDYALAWRPNRPSVFIEVKRVGQSAEADRQLFEYAFHEGVPFAVLTDGRLWSFYLPGQHGSYDDRRVYQLDIVDRNTAESVNRFKRYLEKSRVVSGAAYADAQTDYNASASNREALLTLPKAWAQLLSEPDGELMEVLRARTEVLCGHKPDDRSLEAFIKQQIGPQRSEVVSRAQRQRPVVPAALAAIAFAPPPMSETQSGVSATTNFWRVKEMGGQERNGVEAFVATLTALFEQFPDDREKMAAAVQTRGRNNIAQVIEEIYPNRPELALKNHRVLPGGWFVGTNESTGTKTIIIGKAAAAIGLSIGVDFDFNI